VDSEKPIGIITTDVLTDRVWAMPGPVSIAAITWKLCIPSTSQPHPLTQY